MAVYMDAKQKSKLAIAYIAKYLLDILERCEVFKVTEDDGNEVTYYTVPRHLFDTCKILNDFVIGGDYEEKVVSAVGCEFMTRNKGDVIMYSDKNFITSMEYRNRLTERLEKLGHAANKDFDFRQAYTYTQVEFPGTLGPSGIYVLQYIGCEAARNKETQPYVDEDAIRDIMLRILENGPDSVIMLK